MTTFDPTAYGPAFAPLVLIDRCRSLGTGTADCGARDRLDKLSVETAFAHAKVVDRLMATCCVSAVWLLHDCLDESHTISQGIDTPSGSFWHGIMHRREGDFSNAKYWFRRVGRHEVFAALGTAAAALAAKHSSGEGDSPILLRGLSNIGTVPGAGDWDPYAFVDLCQSAACGQRDAESLCRAVQQAEWELLFDHCYRAAVGE
jgi:hypothetical protein